MKTSYYFIFIIFCLSVFNNSYSQKLLTLDDAVTIALNQNTNLVKSTNSLATFQAGVKNAYGNLIPTLSLGGNFGWQRVTNSERTTQLDSLGNQITTGPTQYDSRFWSVSAGGSVTLFNGLSNLAQISKSKSDFESAKLTLEKLKQDIVLQAITLYTQIISYQKLLNFQEENLKYNEGLLAQIKEKFDLKMVPISDVYSQEAQTANSKVFYLQAKNNLEIAKINLLNYLSIDVSQNYQFDSTAANIKDSTLIKSNIDSLYQYALNNRKDYQSMLFELESSQHQLTIARSGLFPNLSANYGFGSSFNDPANIFNQKVYSLGLSLNIPIFSNWSTENAIQSADVQIQNSNEDLKVLELSIKSQVKTANLNLETTKQQLDASETALTASRESWKIETETYNLGAATYLDLQLSYNNYLQAQYNKISNEFSYIISQYTLLNALGNY
ncbi:MAG TPA: TolC family protein [Ignavibacteriaceae bacterium]